MRLIDADELNEKLERSIEWCRENLSESKASFQGGCIAATKDIINYVLFSKPIDAVPVVHGHWINRRNSVYCSRCGKGYRNGVGTISALNHNYCPNCGAKMDEVSE